MMRKENKSSLDELRKWFKDNCTDVGHIYYGEILSLLTPVHKSVKGIQTINRFIKLLNGMSETVQQDFYCKMANKVKPVLEEKLSEKEYIQAKAKELFTKLDETFALKYLEDFICSVVKDCKNMMQGQRNV